MKSYLIILFITCFVNSYSQADSLRLKNRIDSLMKLDAYNYSVKDYESLHDILNKSKRIGYHKGALLSRIQLIWYYSNHNNLDSLFFQGKKIEEYLSHHYDKELDLLFSKTYGQVLLEFYSSPEIAIGYYLKTLDLINENDHDIKAHVSTALSYAYTLKGDYDKAINEIENLLQSAIVESTDNLIAIDAKCALSLAYQFKGNASKSRVLLNELKEIAQKEKNKRLHSYINLYEGRNYLIEEKYQKAIETIESNFSNLQKHLPHGIRTHYEFLAKSYAGLRDYESAIKFLKKSLFEQTNNDSPELYGLLADYYLTIHKKDSAIHYFNIRDKIVDSIRTLELKVYNDYYATRKENISIKNQNINIEKHNLRLLEKNNQSIEFIIVLGILILIAISFSIVHRKKHKVSKKTIKNTIKKNELLNEILCAKDKKLFNQNILQRQKEEELKYIHDNLINQNSNIIRNLKVNSSIKSLESLIAAKIEKKDIIKNLMDENFLLVAKLKVFCPELSKTEVLHCVLVIQELSLKEVANLLNVSIGTVKSARYRAKLKLNIPKNKSLKRFLLLAQKDIDWLFKQRG